MKTYRIKLKPINGFHTSFQADTIFGHLCWVIAHQDGDKSLQEFLHPFKENQPPFLLSDGFPDELLPKPFSAEFNITDSGKIKEIKRIEYVELSDFNRIRQGSKFEPKQIDVPVTSTATTHNTISRLTNTVFAEGGVYNLPETIIPTISLYLKAISDKWKDKVVDLLTELSKSGYGSKKSIGKGQFFIKEVKEFNEFEELKDADGFVTLSNFCPAKDDPTEGLYKTFVKYGKLGEEFTFCGNPFKRPLLMIKCGSVFKTGSFPKDYYGRMINKDIAPVKPDVVQYAYAFALPVRYPGT